MNMYGDNTYDKREKKVTLIILMIKIIEIIIMKIKNKIITKIIK